MIRRKLSFRRQVLYLSWISYDEGSLRDISSHIPHHSIELPDARPLELQFGIIFNARQTRPHV